MRVALIALIFLSFHAASQQVKVIGRVTDKRSKVLDNVLVRDTRDTSYFVLSNSLGVYEFNANQGDTLHLVFELNDLKEQINVIVDNKQVQRIQDVKFNFILEREVVVDAKRTDPFEIPKLPKYDVQKIPMGSVERSLVYTTAAVSNNELTSNYNVRGGSYD